MKEDAVQRGSAGHRAVVAVCTVVLAVAAQLPGGGLGTPAAGGAAPGAGTAQEEGSPGLGPGAWVTLLTGDRVLVAPTEDGESARIGPSGGTGRTTGAGGGGEISGAGGVGGAGGIGGAGGLRAADEGGAVTVLDVRPGPGRAGMAFHRTTAGDETYVVPSDALALVGQGRLDRRLFDVAGLVRFGYDDDHRPDIPLIVTGDGRAPGGRHAAEARVTDAGGSATRELPSVGGVAVGADKAEASAFWAAMTTGPRPSTASEPSASSESANPAEPSEPPEPATPAESESSGPAEPSEPPASSEPANPAPGSGEATTLAAGLERIWLDGPVQATLDESVPQIGAPEAWANGHTGRGATVAVLDSGIDGTHPDLDDAVIEARDFTGLPGSTTQDRYGHGTHVASIVTGSGDASGGRLVGVAPDARLLVGKVLNDLGWGSESAVIDGMEWAAGQGADVVNMSLGSLFDNDGTGVLDRSVDRLTAETGALFVVAAGNEGPAPETVGSPGSADAALTVGAVDGRDDIADFSSRGPRWGRPAIKPEITAPGVDIAAARAKDTYLGPPAGGGSDSDGDGGGGGDQGSATLSGTSMATPHVAGAAAILAAQHPEWGAAEIKGVLVASASPNPELTVDDQGAGRLDVARADTQPAYATPVAVDAGLAGWPHHDDEPVVTPVTYHNPTASPLTLDLHLDVEDPGGEPAPDAMFELSAPQVTLAPGGTATVELTVDTRVAGPDGRYQGLLVATSTSGDVTVATPVAVTREVESYDLTVEVMDHDGQPTDQYSLMLGRLDQPLVAFPYDASGTVVMRVPAGEYFLASSVGTTSGDRWLTTDGAEPTVAVTGQRTLRVDAREGRPVGITVDPADAELVRGQVDFHRRISGGEEEYLAGPFIDDFAANLVQPSRSTAPGEAFRMDVDGFLARPDGAGGYQDSPYFYGVRWSEEGRVPEDLERHVPDRGLATVEGRIASASSRPTTATFNGVVTMSPPARLTQRYSPGVPWTRIVDTFSDRGGTSQWALLRSFRSGRRYREPWNVAVFGPMDPAMPTLRSDLSPYQVSRQRAWLTVATPSLFSQQGRHLGTSWTGSRSLALYRDGQRLDRLALPGDARFGQLPWEESVYRLEASATHTVADLSTRVDAAWTFRSGGTTGDEPVPLLGVTLAPRLDDHNRAPSGQTFRIPVHVGRQEGAEYGSLDQLTVEVSYDDGQTWQPAQVQVQGRGRGGSWGDDRSAVVTHPPGEGYVSLRTHVTDTHGNSAEATIIRAYALSP